MNNKNLRNLLILIPFFSLIAACATSHKERATHYWQAKDAKTGRDYTIDNGACNEQFGIDETTALSIQSPSFEAYRNCMVEKGYVLRSYH